MIVYIHGKGGSASESERYQKNFPNVEVIGFDYKSENVWDAEKEFKKFFARFAAVDIIANSIGAFYAMHTLSEKNVEKAFFISPVVDMEKIILTMMTRENVTEKMLREEKEIVTNSGEILSWQYLCYVRENPIEWRVPTHILYGEKDFLTSPATMKNFAEKIGATLTVIPGGEHFLHTPEQMQISDKLLKKFF